MRIILRFFTLIPRWNLKLLYELVFGKISKKIRWKKRQWTGEILLTKRFLTAVSNTHNRVAYITVSRTWSDWVHNYFVYMHIVTKNVYNCTVFYAGFSIFYSKCGSTWFRFEIHHIARWGKTRSILWFDMGLQLSTWREVLQCVSSMCAIHGHVGTCNRVCNGLCTIRHTSRIQCAVCNMKL